MTAPGLIAGKYRPLSTVTQGPCSIVMIAGVVRSAHKRYIHTLRLDALDPANPPAAVIRFEQEAALFSSVRHPGLPVVLEHHIENGSAGHLVMEYKPGALLADVLEARQGIPPEDAACWALDLVRALGTLHGRPMPIVHGEITAEAILIDHSGRACLLHYGEARYRPGWMGSPADDVAALGRCMSRLTAPSPSEIVPDASLARLQAVFTAMSDPVDGAGLTAADVEEMLQQWLDQSPSALEAGIPFARYRQASLPAPSLSPERDGPWSDAIAPGAGDSPDLAETAGMTPEVEESEETPPAPGRGRRPALALPVALILANVLVIGALFWILPELKLHADARNQYAACQQHLQALGDALERYELAHDGRYPDALSALAPRQLPALPVCPAAPDTSYTRGYQVSKNHLRFTVMCQGPRHLEGGAPGPDYPKFTSTDGLVTK